MLQLVSSVSLVLYVMVLVSSAC